MTGGRGEGKATVNSAHHHKKYISIKFESINRLTVSVGKPLKSHVLRTTRMDLTPRAASRLPLNGAQECPVGESVNHVPA